MPQAVFKMVRNGGTRSPLATKRQFGYLSQGGAVALEFPESYGGPEATLAPADFRETADEWALRTDKYEPGQAVDDTSPALTSHIVVSFPPGTDAEHARRVGRNFAARMFDDPRRRSDFPEDAEAEHRFPYFTAFHTDRDHPHLHVVVNRRSTEGGWLKIANREGVRSDPRVPDMFTFADLRHGLVDSAIEEGMDLEATTRAERGLARPPMNDVEYRRFMEQEHPRWRAQAAAGDDFIRVENEIDEDGNAAGEAEELNRGHTPAAEWRPVRPQSPRPAAANADGANPAAAAAAAGGAAAAAGADGAEAGPAGRRSRSPAADRHDEALARQQAEAELFAPDDDFGVDAVEDDQDDAGRPDEANDERRPGDVRGAADQAREAAARQRHDAREDAAQAGPSRRRTPAGVQAVDDDEAGPSHADGEGRAPRSRPARGRFGPPNVGTRGIEVSETAIDAALQRWQQAEAAAGSGVATRAQQRAVDEARQAWQEAEEAVQAARANPGRKRRREDADDAASKRARTTAENGDPDSGRPQERDRGR